MPYYPSIDEDLKRAEEILAKGAQSAEQLAGIEAPLLRVYARPGRPQWADDLEEMLATGAATPPQPTAEWQPSAAVLKCQDLIARIQAEAEDIDYDHEAAECAANIIDCCHKLTASLLEVVMQQPASPTPTEGASEEGGTIYGADIYAAYMLLKSFVQHIRYLHQQQDLGEAERERLERFKAKAIKLNRTAHETINMLLERQTELQVKLDAATERIARAMRES